MATTSRLDEGLSTSYRPPALLVNPQRKRALSHNIGEKRRYPRLELGPKEGHGEGARGPFYHRDIFRTLSPRSKHPLIRVHFCKGEAVSFCLLDLEAETLQSLKGNPKIETIKRKALSVARSIYQRRIRDAEAQLAQLRGLHINQDF